MRDLQEKTLNEAIEEDNEIKSDYKNFFALLLSYNITHNIFEELEKKRVALKRCQQEILDEYYEIKCNELLRIVYRIDPEKNLLSEINEIAVRYGIRIIR